MDVYYQGRTVPPPFREDMLFGHDFRKELVTARREAIHVPGISISYLALVLGLLEPCPTPELHRLYSSPQIYGHARVKERRSLCVVY